MVLTSSGNYIIQIVESKRNQFYNDSHMEARKILDDGSPEKIDTGLIKKSKSKTVHNQFYFPYHLLRSNSLSYTVWGIDPCLKRSSRYKFLISSI